MYEQFKEVRSLGAHKEYELRNGNQSNPRFFVVDSINDNGSERNLVTPVNLKTPQLTIPRPIAPKISNVTTT